MFLVKISLFHLANDSLEQGSVSTGDVILIEGFNFPGKKTRIIRLLSK